MRYEVWAIEQLRKKPRCRVEPSMKCIPLRNDPICNACYEGSQTLAKGSTLRTGRKEQDAE